MTIGYSVYFSAVTSYPADKYIVLPSTCGIFLQMFKATGAQIEYVNNMFTPHQRIALLIQVWN